MGEATQKILKNNFMSRHKTAFEKKAVVVHNSNQLVGVVLKLTTLGITHLFKCGETKNQSYVFKRGHDP